jgi:hypothetical protein
MTDLYSYKGAYPYPLPEDMTPYDLADFVLAPPAPVTAPGEKLEWDGAQWSVREPNEAEVAIQWAGVRAQRNELLTASDVFVVRAYEAGQPVPPETVAYRQALRDVTDQTNPFAIVWPAVPGNPIPA